MPGSIGVAINLGPTNPGAVTGMPARGFGVGAPGTIGGINSFSQILSSMNTAHQQRAYGVPSDYNWCYGPLVQQAEPTTYTPSGAGSLTAMTLWGQIYFGYNTGFTSDTNTRIQIRFAEAYCFSISTSTWHVLQQFTTFADYGYAFYSADFQGLTAGTSATFSSCQIYQNSTTANVSSTSGMVPGMVLTGNAGIPSGTVVSSVTNSTTFVMSAQATTNASGFTLTGN